MSPDEHVQPASDGRGLSPAEESHVIGEAVLAGLAEERTSIQQRMAGYDEYMSRYYKEALAQTPEGEGIFFGLDQIPQERREEIVEALKRKLEEYTERLEVEALDPYKAIDGLNSHERYKRDCLRLLLEHGEINTWALSRAYGRSEGGVDELFNSACGVIHDYVQTGGRNVMGGTGLLRT